MHLNAARQAWHDCTCSSTNSQSVFASPFAQLGTKVQTTQGQLRASQAIHQALAGSVQAAIAGLSCPLRAFGNYMYAPRLDARERKSAEEAVFLMVQQRASRMIATKREKLGYLVKGVMARYRYMHLGGQSANAPYEKPGHCAGFFIARASALCSKASLRTCLWSRTHGFI